MNHPEIVMMPIDKLLPADYNPRKISKEALKGLTESVRRFGLVQPIVFNKRSGHVVGGHQRIEALRAAGETSAQVSIIDLNEQEEKALNVALNSPTISGYFTDDLQSILDSLRESLPHEFIDLRLDELIADLQTTNGSDPDEVPDIPKEPTAKLGDLWELGTHRLLCGDAAKGESYKALLRNEKADMIFTDPPYGVDYGKKNRFLNSFYKAGRNLKDIANDMLGKDELFNMLVNAFSASRENSADHCSYYVTSPQGGELGLMMMMMMTSGLPTRHVLIWNKDSQNFSLGRLDYEYKHEPILYAWKKKHRFYGKGQFTNSVWDIPKPKKAVEHPTMKPVELIENAVLNSSKRGDIIMDMFAGSGSTLIACERTQRRARCIEIDPAYCDVIVERWEKFTGQKAKRL